LDIAKSFSCRIVVGDARPWCGARRRKIAYDEKSEQVKNMNETLRLADIVTESVVDGKGIRFTIFTQGCPHRCEGCHNPTTHGFEDGVEMPLGEIEAMIAKNPLLSGVTYSGGEPFVQAGALAELARRVHKRGLDIWCYTGYTLEELRRDGNPDFAALLEQTDVLVDGRFEQDKRDLTLVFRGSSNQRVIDLKKMKEMGADNIILLQL
jgi:anaerobic ribonucleoside-triphosphate reductase activating protein